MAPREISTGRVRFVTDKEHAEVTLRLVLDHNSLYVMFHWHRRVSGDLNARFFPIDAVVLQRMKIKTK